MTSAAPLNDADLLRLEQLLADPALQQAMRLDEAQAYLCAALAGPQPMAEAQWLGEVLGDAATSADDTGREATDLLRRLAAELAAGLACGEPPILLLYAKEGDASDDSDYVPWCQAYLHGVDSAPIDWFDALGAADDKEDSEEICYLDEQLFPLFMLTGDAEAAAAAAGEEWLAGTELEQMRKECEARLPQVVTDIYRFWIARRSVKTIRHDTPKLGRNDACPCGSGKKYKKCCGAT
ncbi:UPF0149 family protein [Accumulibacter sp.]|uniref:YecA/YgfB family protein n=1 Tax=Accumulibacter sp. TaxID=2053492 RepID=UPI00262C96DB|nr:UPF0149 family protein [Accumulibacter sp.]